MSKSLNKTDSKKILDILQKRFEENTQRHPNIKWKDVEKKLLDQPSKLWSLSQMEDSDGEPDVVFFDSKSKEFHFYDCSKETPKARVSLCFDKEAWTSRKENKPKGNAMDLAKEMGTEILDEEEYFYLQSLEPFDLKTSSWLKTPTEIRKLGGAIFGDRRFNRVFIYHNTAISYYGVRGFRTKLIV